MPRHGVSVATLACVLLLSLVAVTCVQAVHPSLQRLADGAELQPHVDEIAHSFVSVAEHSLVQVDAEAKPRKKAKAAEPVDPVTNRSNFYRGKFPKACVGDFSVGEVTVAADRTNTYVSPACPAGQQPGVRRIEIAAQNGVEKFEVQLNDGAGNRYIQQTGTCFKRAWDHGQVSLSGNKLPAKRRLTVAVTCPAADNPKGCPLLVGVAFGCYADRPARKPKAFYPACRVGVNDKSCDLGNVSMGFCCPANVGIIVGADGDKVQVTCDKNPKCKKN